MQRKEELRIHISKPCHENWEAMGEVDRGRFCLSCNKIVTDFSRMSDAEIIVFIHKNKGERGCGNYRNDQLDRPLRPERSFGLRLRYMLHLVLLPFLAFFTSQARAEEKTAVHSTFTGHEVRPKPDARHYHRKLIPREKRKPRGRSVHTKGF